VRGSPLFYAPPLAARHPESYPVQHVHDRRRNQMSSNQEIVARDLSVLWHPCTQMKDHEHLPLIPIRRGDGVWLEDFDGNRYIDAVSSWWVNLFGHANPRINAAVHAQLDRLEHVILAGFSHEPAVDRKSTRLNS